MSSHQNSTTLEAYDSELERYILHTPRNHIESHKPLLKWIDAALDRLPQKTRILEIGSGTGRDAQYIKKQGYDLLCSDAPASFISYLKAKGNETIKLNILTDEIPGKYGMVLANAVVPHFTRDDLALTLTKVHSALLDNGIFAFSAKQGKGHTWVQEKIGKERYIHYWLPDELYSFVEDCGYSIEFIEANIPGDISTHTWINLIARKISVQNAL